MIFQQSTQKHPAPGRKSQESIQAYQALGTKATTFKNRLVRDTVQPKPDTSQMCLTHKARNTEICSEGFVTKGGASITTLGNK
jgi:hypothetical protein